MLITVFLTPSAIKSIVVVFLTSNPIFSSLYKIFSINIILNFK